MKVLGVKGQRDRETQSRTHGSTAPWAWRPLGWFGLLFVVIGLADMALVWYPLRPGNPTWEFGAIDLAFSTLPVLTIGIAAVLAAALGRGRRRAAMFWAVMCTGLGLACVAGYLVFLSDVPLALRNAPAEVLTGVKKAVFRNTVFGVAFASAYLGAGIAVLRYLATLKKDGTHDS